MSVISLQHPIKGPFVCDVLEKILEFLPNEYQKDIIRMTFMSLKEFMTQSWGIHSLLERVQCRLNPEGGIYRPFTKKISRLLKQRLSYPSPWDTSMPNTTPLPVPDRERIVRAHPVAQSPSGQRCVIGGDSFRVWDVPRQKKIWTPLIGDQGDLGDHELFTCGFSPSERILATGFCSGRIQLLGIEKKRYLQTLNGPWQHASTIFSPDELLLGIHSKDYRDSLTVYQKTPYEKVLIKQLQQPQSLSLLRLAPFPHQLLIAKIVRNLQFVSRELTLEDLPLFQEYLHRQIVQLKPIRNNPRSAPLRELLSQIKDRLNRPPVTELLTLGEQQQLECLKKAQALTTAQRYFHPVCELVALLTLNAMFSGFFYLTMRLHLKDFSSQINALAPLPYVDYAIALLAGKIAIVMLRKIESLLTLNAMFSGFFYLTMRLYLEDFSSQINALAPLPYMDYAIALLAGKIAIVMLHKIGSSHPSTAKRA